MWSGLEREKRWWDGSRPEEEERKEKKNRKNKERKKEKREGERE